MKRIELVLAATKLTAMQRLGEAYWGIVTRSGDVYDVVEVA